MMLLAVMTAIAMEAKQTDKQYFPVRNRLDVTSLDGTWQFKLDGDTDWRYLKVPGNWETQGVKVPEYGTRLSETTGTYKRTFEWKNEWTGKDLILRLDAIQNGFTVFVNGHEVGNGQSAHTMHQFNITPFVKEARNEIEIRVSSHSKYWRFDVCDAWSFTGIKSSVELFAVSREANIADVIFTSKVNKDNSADLAVTVKTNGDGKVTASLLDERYNHVCDMKAVATDGCATMTARLDNPKLWNAETPNLYRLDVKLYSNDGSLLQSVQEKVGIREVRVEDGKILLNNREIFLRGACLSENDAIEGSAMSHLNRRKQLQQMKAANINFIRFAHYPLDPVVARLCDEMGFYVCNEIPFAARGDVYLKSDPNVVDELKARAKATVDRDRNCPSIIMYTFGNENGRFKSQDSVLLFAKNYDPTRLRGLPQKKGEFITSTKKPSPYVDVICGHYANDGVLADAVKHSKLPIVNTEYAHSLGTAFGDLEHKYEIFRREPKIAGGSVWCYQDQAVLTNNFNQQNQVQKGVRIDSLRYIDSYGINPVADGIEQRKEGADGVVYGDGYPQEDYFLLAQVYTPVYIDEGIKAPHTAPEGASIATWEAVVENRFNFISLHGYSIEWQQKQWHKVIETGKIYLSAEAGEKETISIPINKDASHICMQVLRPDGSLCYERSVKVDKLTSRQVDKLSDSEASNSSTKSYSSSSKPLSFGEGLGRGSAFNLRVGRPLEIGLDYRRKNLWYPYMLSPSIVKVKKRKGVYHITCRWESGTKAKNYIDGEILMKQAKDGTTTIDYTLTPSDSIGGKFLEYGLTLALPADYTDVAWLGKGPFSQTPDKTAYNNYGTWRLHKDDIRFYGNRAGVELMTICSPNATLTLYSDNTNLLLENIDGRIHITDNKVVGTYGNKFVSPTGKDANKTGRQTGHITIKANASELVNSIFGPLKETNPEQPYMEVYGK